MRTLLRSSGTKLRFSRENVSYSRSSIDYPPQTSHAISKKPCAYEKPDLSAGRPDHLG
jgi:hypothetical protein